MEFEDARSQLAKAFEAAGADRPAGTVSFGLTEEEEKIARRRAAEQLAGALLKDAMARGVSHLELTPELRPLSGGAAADFVFRMRAHMSFIVKVQRDAKLREEALWLKSLHPDVPNGTPWGTLFPRVFAQQLSTAPYAYAMEDFRREDGYHDLAWWIFDSELLPEVRQLQAERLVEAVLERLQSVYRRSKNTNSRPSLDGEAYLQRIEGRLQKACGLYAGFTTAATVEGHSLKPWQSYVDTIKAQRAKVEALFPAFETAVHGDSHPGNIIVRLRGVPVDGLAPEIRLIDPKGWKQGDYVFDLAKLAHYIEVTGPLERWDLAQHCRFVARPDVLEVTALPTIPAWLNALSARVRESTTALGHALGDPHAGQRFALAMASTLLGSVVLRLESKQQATAVAMYVTGLRWLAEFCDAL